MSVSCLSEQASRPTRVLLWTEFFTPRTPTGRPDVDAAVQRAMVGDRLREIYDRQAKERQGKRTDLMVTVPGSGGTACDLAGKAVGVSGSMMDSDEVQKEGTPEEGV